MKSRIRNIIHGLLAVATATMLQGCIRDFDECATDEAVSAGDGFVTLNIQMLVPSMGASTRASEHTETDDGNKAENFINVEAGDYSIYILDNENGDDVIMQRFEPTSTLLQEVTDGFTSSNEVSRYMLTGKFQPEGMKNIRVMVLANWMYGCKEAPVTAPSTDIYGSGISLGHTKLSDLYANATGFNFDYKQETGNEATPTWIPTYGGSGIPMFGISGPVSLKPEDVTIVNNDNENNPIIGDINMLRSLAKIEIVDAIDHDAEDEGKEVEITECRLTWYNTEGRYIPNLSLSGNNDDWETEIGNSGNYYQVSSPSLPDGTLKSSVPLKFVKVDEDGKVSDGGKKYVIYIPEMGGLNSLSADARPKIELDIAVGGKQQNKPYEIELAEYDSEGKPNLEKAYPSLLRNHLYRFNVNSIKVGVSADLIIHISTQEWEMDRDDEYTYEDIMTEFAAGGTFKWDVTACNFEESETDATQEQRTLIVTRYGGAEGTFTIKEPARGTWTLALYADDDTPNDAFNVELWGKYMEVQEDGTEVEKEGWLNGSDNMTGSIAKKGETPSEVRFRIVATGDPSSTINYTARLAMIVKTFDERIMEVNLPWFNDDASRTNSDGMPAATTDNNGYYYVKQLNTGF